MPKPPQAVDLAALAELIPAIAEEIKALFPFPTDWADAETVGPWLAGQNNSLTRLITTTAKAIRPATIPGAGPRLFSPANVLTLTESMDPEAAKLGAAITNEAQRLELSPALILAAVKMLLAFMGVATA